MKKKRILLFSDWYLPGYKAGGPIRSIQSLVENLGDELDIFIVTGSRDYNSDLKYDNVYFNQWNKVGKASVFYIKSNFILNIYKLINGISPDIIYLNSVFSFWFTFIPLLLNFVLFRKQVILSPRGMLATGALDIKSQKKKIYLAIFKQIIQRSKIKIHSTSIEESLDVRRILGIDSFFAPNFPSVLPRENIVHPVKKKGECNFISIARISPEKNLLYAIQQLKDLKGSVVFDVYGSINDIEYFNKCKKAVNSLPSTIRVNFHGSVAPEFLSDRFSKSHFLYLPTLGENFGHIILESLYFGCPVIISDRTPWKRLNFMDIGWDISLDHPEYFHKVLQACIDMSDHEFKKMSLDAIHFAQLKYADPEARNLNLKLFSI